MKIAIVARLSDNKLVSKLAPLAELNEVSQIDLVRIRPIHYRKTKNHCPPRILQSILPVAEFFRVISLLRICMDKTPPELIIGINLIPHGIYAGLYARIFGINYIQLLIGEDVQLVAKNKVARNWVDKAYLIGVRGNAGKRLLIGSGIHEQKIFIPPNVINASAYSKYVDKKKIFDFIFIGKLIKRKQVQNILQAFSLLLGDFPNLRLAIVGDGPEKSRLTNLSQNMEISGNVVFHGQVNSDRVPNFLARSKVLVLASAMEGLPMALVEAFASGIPAIVSNMGDVNDIAVNEVNSLITNNSDPDEIYEAMRRFLVDPSLARHLTDGAVATGEALLQSYSIRSAMEVWKNALSTIMN